MKRSRAQIFEIVRMVLCEALNAEEEVVTLESHVFLDLGMESIDVLDIVFGLERELNVKMRSDGFEEMFVYRVPDTWQEWKEMKLESRSWRESQAPIDWREEFRLSRNARARKKEYEDLCKVWGVRPYSVGMICRMVKQLLDSGASSRRADPK